MPSNGFKNVSDNSLDDQLAKNLQAVDLNYKIVFPYDTFRPKQEEIISEISKAIESKKNTILIATNGTGKTIMALSAALPIALKKKKKIIFCARTFTQNQRVIDECKAIIQGFEKKNLDYKIGAVSLRGRNEMCPHKMLQRLKLPPRESMSVCSSLRKSKRCRYFNNLVKKKNALNEEIDYFSKVPSNAQDLMTYLGEKDMCPYFFSKMLMKSVDLVVCNYQWVFEPNIRESFLESLEVKLDDCIIIMDECHNLPEMATGINSFKLTPYSLRQALKDLELYRANKDLIRFVRSIREILDEVKSRIIEETGIEKESFLQYLLKKTRQLSIRELKNTIEDLRDYGEAIEKQKIDENKVSRDFIGGICDFFESFLDSLHDQAYYPCFTSTISGQGKSVALELKCLDPKRITNPIFQKAYATLSLSGTLHAPSYTYLLNLENGNKLLKIFHMPPPFPKKNIEVLLIDELNTKGSSRSAEMYKKILFALQPILLFTPKNVGVFCASYDVLEGLWEMGFESLAKNCKKKVFREQQDNSASDNDVILEKFKSSINDSRYNGAVLLGVSGGRNSEGEDFPGDYMNSVVIVGIPFQKPTPSGEAKISYYEQHFPRKGRLFSYITPAFNRANQACGRPIRTMKDRGLIVLMDNRFDYYKDLLSDWVRENMKKVPNNPKKIAKYVLSFFYKKKGANKKNR